MPNHRIVACFLLFFLLSAAFALGTTPLYAAPEDGDGPGAGYEEAQRILNERFEVEQGTMLERMLAGVINSIAGAITGAFGMMPLDVMLFGDNVRIADDRHRTWLFIDGYWKDYAMPAYRAFGYVAYALMLITIISAGVKMGLTTWLSPAARANVSQMAFNWVVASILLVTLPSLFDLLLQLNDALVSLVFGLAGGAAPGAVPDILNQSFAGESVVTGSALLSSIVNLAIAVFVFYFNIMFMLRWFVIVALFAVSPLVIWAWAKGQATAFFLWLGECISNFMTQFVYAFVFVLVLGITMSANVETPWWMYLVIMMAIIPLGTLLRRLITQWLNIIGLDEEGAAGRVVGSGVGSLMAVGGALAGGGRRAYSAPVGGGPGGAAPGGADPGGGAPVGGTPRSGIGGAIDAFRANPGRVTASAVAGTLKTGAAVAIGTTVALGTAPVLGQQGIAMGAGLAGGINRLDTGFRSSRQTPPPAYGQGGGNPAASSPGTPKNTPGSTPPGTPKNTPTMATPVANPDVSQGSSPYYDDPMSGRSSNSSFYSGHNETEPWQAAPVAGGEPQYQQETDSGDDYNDSQFYAMYPQESPVSRNSSINHGPQYQQGTIDWDSGRGLWQ